MAMAFSPAAASGTLDGDKMMPFNALPVPPSFSLFRSFSDVTKPVNDEGIVSLQRAQQVTYGADSDFVVRLDGKIEQDSANKVKAKLFELARKNSNREIILEINSGGGSVPDGWNIIDAMNSIPNKVTTVCQRAESMAAVILIANVSGDRYAYPRCRIMLHEPSWEIKGTASEMAQRANDIMETRKLFADKIEEATGMPARMAMEFIASGDTVLSAEQSYKLNFLDGILPGPINKVNREARPPSLSSDFCTGERLLRMQVCQPGNNIAVMGGSRPGAAQAAGQTSGFSAPSTP